MDSGKIRKEQIRGTPTREFILDAEQNTLTLVFMQSTYIHRKNNEN